MDPSFLTILKCQRQCWTRPVNLMCGGAWGGGSVRSWGREVHGRAARRIPRGSRQRFSNAN